MSNRSPERDIEPCTYRLDRDVVRIGRAPDNDVVLDDLLVARHHARLCRIQTGWEITDLGSVEGTHLNGARVRRATAGPGDVIAVGHHHLRLQDDRLEEYADSGDVWLVACGLTTTTPSGRILLSDINFALPPQSMMAIIGPAGGSNTMLLESLSGRRPANTGYLGYGDRDFYQNYAELRHRIAYMSGCHILHNELTLGRALRYAAQLRLPEANSVERRERVAEVAAEVDASAYLNSQIGPRKAIRRMMFNVSAELMARPSLLFLDEPSSGLDPGMNKALLQRLGSLARSVCSVVIATSCLWTLDCFDRVLVLAPGGRMAYFGPPQQMVAYFVCADIAEMFEALDADTSTDWAARFADSSLYDTYVTMPTNVIAPKPAAAAEHARCAQPPPMVQHPRLAQFAMLCQRNAWVMTRSAVGHALMPLWVSLLSWLGLLVIGGGGLSVARALAQHDTAPRQLLLLLMTGGVLLGLTTAPLCHAYGEFEIYCHERGLGLSRGAYLAAKLTVLAPVAAAQRLVLGLLGPVFVPGPDDAVLIHPARLEVAVAMVAVAVASMVIGVGIATLFDLGRRRNSLIASVLAAQMLLCGGLFPFDDLPLLSWLSWLSPSRWAYAMGASTVNLQSLHASGTADPLWRHDTDHWLGALGGCGAATLAMVVAVLVLLGKVDRY